VIGTACTSLNRVGFALETEMSAHTLALFEANASDTNRTFAQEEHVE
jgi:hypothetical protein